MSQERQQDAQMELTGPGRRLMEARCALNLSREDVARQLRLKQEIIASIEEDRIDELPAPIYVVGYLRNYAGLLKLPHEPIVDAYQQLSVEAPPIVNDVVKPQSKKLSRRVTRWGSILIGIALLAGFISWLQKQDFDFLQKEAPTESIAERIEPPAEQQPVVENEAVEDVPVVESEVIEPLPVEEPVVSSVEAVLQAEMSETPKSEVSAEPASAEKLPPAGDKIVVTLKDDCWVDIKDVNGKVVIYDLLRKGRTHTFYGVSPFTVFMGNANAVELSVNGEPYDITPHIRGKLARFTLQVPSVTE